MTKYCIDPDVWFDESWIGRIVKIKKYSRSWKIVEKFECDESRFVETEFTICGFFSEACGVFICEDIKDSSQAIMKIRMQYAMSSLLQIFFGRHTPLQHRTLTIDVIRLIGFHTKKANPVPPNRGLRKHYQNGKIEQSMKSEVSKC